MQGAALRLTRLLERRGRLAAVLWLVVTAVSVPFALRQSEDLTGSGFDVPGSGSDRVRQAVEHDFPDADQAKLAAVLVAQADARPAALMAAVGRLETELAGVPAVSIPLRAKELGLRTAASGVVVVGLSVLCTRPDHRDALAAEVVAVIPLRGVEAVARELVAAVDAGKRRLVELPRRDDDRVGVSRAAVGARDRPAAQLVVPPARADFGVQDDQPVDAVIAGDSVQVIEDLALRRAQPRPVAALGE